MSNVTNTISDALGNVSPAQDQEVIFYEGSPKLRGEFGLVFKCVMAAIVLAAVPIVYGMINGRGDYPWWLAAACWVGAVLVLILPLVLVRKNRYRISNYRIDYEQGLLSKRIDTIELWHVDDVQMMQTLLDRILGVGTINIHSNDPTTPVLLLRSLPEPRKLLDAIKTRIIAVKRQRGVVKFSGGGNPHDMGGADLGDHHHPTA